MRIVYIGTVDFSYHLLRQLLQIPFVKVVGIVTKKHSNFNADFCSLSSIAFEHDIPCYYAEEGTCGEMAAWIKEKHSNVIYCFGWSHLLPQNILDIPALGVIGYHPTELPKNRGRHPIIWALALGLKRTGSTFFFMDSDVDAGDILSQVSISITSQDDAGSLYNKLLENAKIQLKNITFDLKNDVYKRTPQNNSLANYWRKRSVKDGLIDWRMSAEQIHNLVRALTRPYPGAYCTYMGMDIRVWSVGFKKEPLKLINITPGQVVAINEKYISVKCADGIVNILEHEFNDVILKVGDHVL